MQLVASGERLTRSEYEARYGADPEDVKQVEAFARAHGLTVSERESEREDLEAHGDRRGLRQGVSGGIGVIISVPEATYRGRTGSSVHSGGLEGRDRQPFTASTTGLRRKRTFALRPTGSPPRCSANASTSVSYTPLQVAQLYDFPAGVNGQGQTIGIIELGGGYTQSDLDSYFSALGISPAPSVSAVSVDGAQNQPTGDTSGPDAEVMLDIEVAGSVAPGAKIAVYFAPNTDSGFLDAINQAVGDKQNNPSVISISWGGAESTWTAQSLQSYNSALEAASAVGVSVCIAAGDDGSTDGVTDGLQHVDFPASSPYATGLRRDAPRRQRQHDHRRGSVERPSRATGPREAASAQPSRFPPGRRAPTCRLPSIRGTSWAAGCRTWRATPIPSTGYQVEVDGSNIVVGGTSAVAPLWAGLIACFNSNLKTSVGYFNPTLYQQIAAAAGTFHDITSGNNGSYKAGPGWDACTGWGSPNGAAILQALAGTSTGSTSPPPKNANARSGERQAAGVRSWAIDLFSNRESRAIRGLDGPIA